MISEEDIEYVIGWHMDTQRRLYDVLLAILAKDNPSGAKELQRIHEEGRFLYPPPWRMPNDPPEPE